MSLDDAGLLKFFDDRRAAFLEAARAAYDYAEGYVEQIGLPLRRDDVAKILIPALTTNEDLREYLNKKKLRQQYWYRNFADLVLDRLWDELEDDDDEGEDAP